MFIIVCLSELSFWIFLGRVYNLYELLRLFSASLSLLGVCPVMNGLFCGLSKDLFSLTTKIHSVESIYPISIHFLCSNSENRQEEGQ